MKTLRQYVVNGGLYAGDGKTPATVGDQVRLYLDTEAHEDFPESIVGTIQHPVAPILSGTAISYSFEYDEADLEDVVANLIVADVISVTVTSAVDIVAGELTTEAAARAAADAVLTAGQTPAAIVEKLSGETLEPASIILPDFEDSFGPIGGIGLRGGVLAVGNGEDTNDLAAPRRVAGMVVCDLNGTNKVSSRFAVVGIPLTASEVVAGASVQIVGTIKLLFSNAFYVPGDPVLSATIGFAHNTYKTEATTKWLKYNCLPTSAGAFVFQIINHIAGDFQISTNATPGPNKVVLQVASPVAFADRMEFTDPDFEFVPNDTSIAMASPTDTSVAVTEEVADTLWLSVEIVMGASGTNGNINFAVIYDLDTAVTLP